MSSSYAAKIVCRRPAPLKFMNIVNLVMNNLSILYCGYIFMTLGNNPAVFFFNITSLKLSHISVENGTGDGIMGINILGNSSVSYTQDLYSTITTP